MTTTALAMLFLVFQAKPSHVVLSVCVLNKANTLSDLFTAAGNQCTKLMCRNFATKFGKMRSGGIQPGLSRPVPTFALVSNDIGDAGVEHFQEPM